MKKVNLYYRIFTTIIGLMMLASGIPNILAIKPAVDLFTSISLPIYLIPFVGVAKVLGAIAILIPGYPRIKEWAYAGLAYDLIGALYLNAMAGKPTSEWLPILLPIVLLFISYFLYHKKRQYQITK